MLLWLNYFVLHWLAKDSHALAVDGHRHDLLCHYLNQYHHQKCLPKSDLHLILKGLLKGDVVKLLTMRGIERMVAEKMGLSLDPVRLVEQLKLRPHHLLIPMQVLVSPDT